MGLLHRFWVRTQPADLVMSSVEGDAVVGEKGFENANGLDNAFVPHHRWIQRDSALLVVDWHRAGPDTEFEPTLG